YLPAVGRGGEGAPAPVGLAAEKRNGDLVRRLVAEGLVTAVHDLSDGGLLVALAEMAMSSGIGARTGAAPSGVAPNAFWFGEDQGRYLLTIKPELAEAVIRAGQQAQVPMLQLGITGGDALTLPGERPILLSTLSERFEGWLPAYMAAGAT